MTRRDDLRRRLDATRGRGRKLRGIIEMLRPYRRQTALMFVALVLGTAAGLAPAPLAKQAIDRGITKGDTSALTVIVILFIISALIVWITSYLQTYLTNWVGQRALQDLRLDVFRHLQEMPVGFYERRPAGVLISRLTNDVEALEQMVTDAVTTLFQASLTLVGSIMTLDVAISGQSRMIAASVPSLARFSIASVLVCESQGLICRAIWSKPCAVSRGSMREKARSATTSMRRSSGTITRSPSTR